MSGSSNNAPLPNRPRFQFCLFVAGKEPNSRQARENLDKLCSIYFPNNHSIKVVDVMEDPQMALDKNIFITPALIIEEPFPALTIFGNLRNTEKILSACGLDVLDNENQ